MVAMAAVLIHSWYCTDVQLLEVIAAASWHSNLVGIFDTICKSFGLVLEAWPCE